VGHAAVEGEDRPAPPRARDPGAAEEKDESRRDFDADCLRSGCHAGLNKTTFVHAPVAVGACANCHEPEGEASAHRFRYVRAESELCSFCHRPKTAAKFVHTAYREGQCSGCHDPHGGRDALYLKNEDRSVLCLGCHDAALAPPHEPGGERIPFPFRHEPVVEGRCAECHEAHQSDQPDLLPVPERDLCLVCHQTVLTDLRAAAHVHEPLETACGSCHTGHGGADPGLLRAPERDLCLGCHASVLEVGRERGGIHPPLDAGASCLDCHEAHASASPGLVAADVSGACYACHAREILLDGGRKVADVKAEVAGARFVHEPVAKGACQACHAGHASGHGELLARPYPLEIYAEFSERAFDLCFECHDAGLATAERTTSTRFRDGDRNLHFVHVNQRKSRTCALCHRAHASEHPALIRDQVPFGPEGWPLRIGFRRTETGGACASGCHQELGYRNAE
jgi:predicted CXXCH cytochrome family protein